MSIGSRGRRAGGPQAGLARAAVCGAVALAALAAAACGSRPGAAASATDGPAALVAPGAPAAAAAAVTGGGGSGLAASGLWDDGNAEINAYEAAIRRYGVPRSFTAYHIVVKEDLSRAQLVKADPGHDPADLVTVLKLNQVLEFRTGIYSYNQMASTFHERATMDLLKFSLTSFEWCGNTFKEYTRGRGGRGTLHVHTYWDGQARAEYALPAEPDVLFYDELPLRLRALPQSPGASLTVRLVPTQIESKGPKPELRSAALRAAGEELVVVPAGSFRALRWELKAGREVDSFWLDRKFPHLLLAWDKPDGSALRLKWSQRLPYWTLNRPGDEKYLEGPRPAGSGPAR